MPLFGYYTGRFAFGGALQLQDLVVPNQFVCLSGTIQISSYPRSMYLTCSDGFSSCAYKYVPWTPGSPTSPPPLDLPTYAFANVPPYLTATWSRCVDTYEVSWYLQQPFSVEGSLTVAFAGYPTPVCVDGATVVKFSLVGAIQVNQSAMEQVLNSYAGATYVAF